MCPALVALRWLPAAGAARSVRDRVDLRPVVDLRGSAAGRSRRIPGPCRARCRPAGSSRVWTWASKTNVPSPRNSSVSMIPLDSSSIVSLFGSAVAPVENRVESNLATTPRAPSLIRYATIRARWLTLPGSSWMSRLPWVSMVMLSGLCILASPAPRSSLPSRRSVSVAPASGFSMSAQRRTPEPAAIAIERPSRVLAVVLATLGGEEVEVVRVVRIPVAVLDPVEAEAVGEGVGVLGGAASGSNRCRRASTGAATPLP